MGPPSVRRETAGKLAPWLILALFVLSGVYLLGGPAQPAHPVSAQASGVHPGVRPNPLPPSSLVLPPHGKGHPARSLHGLTVYPYNFYPGEPAPMGIADFGVDNSTANAYTYTTSSFWGTALIHRLTLYNANSGSYSYDGTMQLNVVLHFVSGGNSFAYWVQDVLYISTATNTVTFENNIWNFTDGNSAGMLSSTISGGGSVYSYGGLGFYYAAAGSQSGNGIKLSYPATVQLRVNSTVIFGTPRVTFQFEDGKGWQTYDIVNFVFTKTVKAAYYLVDGNSNAYSYLFNDAELSWGGPGGGASTNMTQGSMEMGLEFYNGHNYQTIPNAFNFGSNTGEAVWNVLGSLWPNATTGQYQSHLFSSSRGTVKNLYDRHIDALFNGTTALPGGTYAVNGYVLGTFYNHAVNITLMPGRYNISLLVNGTPSENVTVQLVAGQYLAYDFDYHYHPPDTFPLIFTSLGLPAGTPWGITVYNVNANSSGNSLLALVPNGTFRWVVGFVPGFHPNVTAGFVTVNGLGKNFTIGWSIMRYSVTAVAVGLPANRPWTVVLNGTSNSVTGSSVQTQLANGTYNFSVGALTGYHAAVPSGNFTVRGSDYSLTIDFVRILYVAAFTETGLPTASGWVLSIDGVNHSTGGTELRLNLPNGTYEYSVTTGSPFLANPDHGTLLVSGTPSPVAIAFVPEPGTVFGAVLPGNATFLVNGTPVALASGSYSIQLAPGSYRIVVTAPGYHGYYYNFTIAPGQPLRVDVHLTPIAPTGIHNSVGANGIWTPLTFLILFGVAAAVVVGLVGAFARRGTPPPNRTR
jgi:thermopsin